jgi:hypothetical protein
VAVMLGNVPCDKPKCRFFVPDLVCSEYRSMKPCKWCQEMRYRILKQEKITERQDFFEAAEPGDWKRYQDWRKKHGRRMYLSV